MLPSICLWALGHASLVLSAPATSPNEISCVPTFNVPDTPKEYTTIPLGPGMRYCDSTSPAISETSSNQDKSSAIVSTNDKDTNEVSGKNPSSDTGASEQPPHSSSSGPNPPTSDDTSNHTPPPQTGPGANNTQTPEPTDSPNTASSNQVYQATITAYGGQCGSQPPACGFLGTTGSYQAAVSTYWNTPGLPGQCGTCWRLTNATQIDGNKQKAAPLGTPPIVVMIDNVCAPDPSKPTGGPDGYQCNQNQENTRDAYGSVTVVDLCADTGASDKFWGSEGSPPNPGEDGHTAGLAVAWIERVDCGEMWEGQVGDFQDWSRYVATAGAEDAVGVKPGR